MDSFQPLKYHTIEQIYVEATRYKEWQGGQCVSEGRTSLTFTAQKVLPGVEGEGCYDCACHCSDFNMDTHFDFDTIISLPDRLMLCMCPQECNVRDLTIEMLKNCLGATRQSAHITPTRPVTVSMFFDGGEIAQIAFKLQNPERIIELW